jgi:hypothetical protein
LIERRLRERQAGSIWAWLGAMLMAVLMVVIAEQLNPDWLGYERIYHGGGSWLLEQGRDPIFILLVDTASGLLGSEGYPMFRGVLGAGFAVFAYMLIRGRIVPFAPRSVLTFSVLVALLPLLVPRFTVQIREGLAMLFVVGALGLLLRWEDPQSKARSTSTTTKTGILVVVMLTIAYGTHAGTAIISGSMLLAWLIARLTAGSLRMEFNLILGIAMIATGLSVAIATLVPSTTWGTQTIARAFGWLVDGSTSMSLGKWIYWLVYGWGIFSLIANIVAMASVGALGPVTRPFATLMALVLLPALYLCALILLVSGVPPIVVSAVARMINMVTALLMLIVAFRGRVELRLGLFALFVLVDQVRIIGEAVLTTLDTLP